MHVATASALFFIPIESPKNKHTMQLMQTFTRMHAHRLANVQTVIS